MLWTWPWLLLIYLMPLIPFIITHTHTHTNLLSQSLEAHQLTLWSYFCLQSQRVRTVRYFMHSCVHVCNSAPLAKAGNRHSGNERFRGLIRAMEKLIQTYPQWALAVSMEWQIFRGLTAANGGALSTRQCTTHAHISTNTHSNTLSHKAWRLSQRLFKEQYAIYSH